MELKTAALSRSRGGPTSKVHLAADLSRRPLCFALTPGQAGGSPQFRAVLSRIKVRGPVGRPRTNRSCLRARGIKAVIPEKAYQAANRKKKGGRGGRPVSRDAGNPL